MQSLVGCLFHIDGRQQQQTRKYAQIFEKVLRFMFGIYALIDIPKVMQIQINE
jgi:uncharacterized protein YhhL (DUF1145 family)